MAAGQEEVRKRPLLLRWIAQHRKAPEALRAALMPRLPWRALAAIASDPSAHPKARSTALERLTVSWSGLSLGEKRSLAFRAPQPLWPQVWKVRNEGVTLAFLQHPRLSGSALIALIQPPLLPTQADALALTPWRELQPLAFQVLQAMDATFQLHDNALVLGQAAPWIKSLSQEARLEAASRLTHPPLRRMVRTWAHRSPQDEDDL